MSVDAVEQIRADLGAEAKVRTRRGWLLLLFWGAAAVGLSLVLGVRGDLEPSDGLAQAVAGAFVLFGAVVSFSPSLRFGRWSARAIGVVAVLSPLLAAHALGDADTVLAGTLGCLGTIVAIGFVVLVVSRLLLGRTRRRFGGAPLLQGVGAAMVGSLAVGLHCPLSSAAHLATHAVGVLVVAALLRRLILTAS